MKRQDPVCPSGAGDIRIRPPINSVVDQFRPGSTQVILILSRYLLMAERLNIYHPRSPRYVLLTSENKVIRFRNPNSNPESHGTEIINVSKTGLAFRYSGDNPPEIGELITIQFHVPGRDQMACFAEVIRHDADLFGIRFIDLNLEQRLNLSWGLKKSFDRLDEYQRWNRWRQRLYIAWVYKGLLTKISLSYVGYFAALYHLALGF